MKKISYIFFDLLTIAFLIGAYAIQYFTKKKLGMLRWVNYHNIQFQKSTVYGIVKYITVVVTIVLIVLIIAGYKKKKEMLGKIDLVMIMVMSVLGIVYLGITIFKSIETLAAYYLSLIHISFHSTGTYLFRPRGTCSTKYIERLFDGRKIISSIVCFAYSLFIF